MKTVSVRDLQKKIGECVDAAQEGRIVVTRHGKPALLLVGVEGKDWETLFWETDEQLWRDIATRREQKTITMAEMRRRLRRTRAARRPSASAKNRRKQAVER